MKFKDYLMTLRWNTFSTYPEQWSAIYIHCFSNDIHKFVKVSSFNAVNFDFQKITKKFIEQTRWQFSWLPAQKIEDDYDNRVNGGSNDDDHSPASPETNARNSETVCDTGKEGRRDKTIKKRTPGRSQNKTMKTYFFRPGLLCIG